MRLIGLTGGIASGKSTIARRLAEHGAVHLDADQIAREQVAPGSAALKSIKAAFGDRVLAADGSLDRAALGSIVFTDAEARRRLNEIVHPVVWRRSDELIEQARRADPDAIVIYNVPLLLESASERRFDLIVVADAPAELRQQRLVQERGMTSEQAAARITAQASDNERRRIADVVIDTSGTLAETLRAADDLWVSLNTAHDN